MGQKLTLQINQFDEQFLFGSSSIEEVNKKWMEKYVRITKLSKNG